MILLGALFDLLGSKLASFFHLTISPWKTQLPPMHRKFPGYTNTEVEIVYSYYCIGHHHINMIQKSVLSIKFLFLSLSVDPS